MLAQAVGSTTELGANGILIGGAIAFGIFAMMKGIARLLLFFGSIGAGAAAGYFAYLNSDTIIAKANLPSESWTPMAIASVAGIGGAFALRSLVKTFFIKPPCHYGNRKFGFGAKAGFIGLFIGIVFVASGMSGLRYADAIAQLKHLKTNLVNGTDEDLPMITKIRGFLDRCRAGQWLQKGDPLNDPDKLKAAKMLVMTSLMSPQSPSDSSPLASQLAPTTGAGHALAGSPEIHDHVQAEEFSAILQSDVIKEMLEDPMVRKHIHELELETLINGDSGWKDKYR